MSLWSRVRNVFRRDGLNLEIDEELESHITEAIAEGRDPREARRAFGSALRRREESRDARVAVWLDALRADSLFGLRQLWKHKAASLTAIFSLALAMGACTSAFRLIDALLLRPLPVAEPHNLFILAYEFRDHLGATRKEESFEYPLFRHLRESAGNQAELIAISHLKRFDLTFSTDAEMEKAWSQYVSGWMFPSFGLKAALGRLLTPDDDRKPGAHPYAVLSHDYWTRRFGQDPKIIGRTFRHGNLLYEIVGVAEEGFTGSETGTFTDIFIPTMMNARAIEHPHWSWFRTWVRIPPQASLETVRQRLQPAMSNYRREKAKSFSGQLRPDRVEQYIRAPLSLEPAWAGVSGLKKDYGRPLQILGVLVLLVLLISCVNVANLMTAWAASRAREMALRVAIGAGRLRLAQLVLVESALIVGFASLLGGLFSWWSAPFVIRMINPTDNPVRLMLPTDLRLFGFAFLLAAVVTALFGLMPALRASAVQPAGALRGGENPHSGRRLRQWHIAAQAAFCVLVLFSSILFVTTFHRVSNQPTGFTSAGLFVLDVSAKDGTKPSRWDQVAERLRTVPGVESAAISEWALMSGNIRTEDILENGRPVEEEVYFLAVSPGWLETMRIGFLGGRGFRPEEFHRGVAIVNEAFSKRFLQGQNPVGRLIESNLRIVGYVQNARYRDMRETFRPSVYVPFHAKNEEGAWLAPEWGTFLVRTSAADPLALAQTLRREVQRAAPEFYVSNIRTQTELVQSHTIRERLLAMLAVFFAVVVLMLAGAGLYGVLNYSVVERRKEIGIRMALGAQAAQVARRVTADVFGMLAAGAAAGLAGGIASRRFIEALLFEVQPTELTILAAPMVALFATALVAALPPVIQAVRLDPSSTLRAE
jgi:predicted permease